MDDLTDVCTSDPGDRGVPAVQAKPMRMFRTGPDHGGGRPGAFLYCGDQMITWIPDDAEILIDALTAPAAELSIMGRDQVIVERVAQQIRDRMATDHPHTDLKTLRRGFEFELDHTDREDHRTGHVVRVTVELDRVDAEAARSYLPIAGYKGINRAGTSVMGGVPGTKSVAEFVQSKFRAGWQTLSVNQDGREVGRIGRNEETGRRTWWVEGS